MEETVKVFIYSQNLVVGWEQVMLDPPSENPDFWRNLQFPDQPPKKAMRAITNLLKNKPKIPKFGSINPIMRVEPNNSIS